MDNWSSIYFTQLFTTLGQLSAVILSGAVVVPMVNYYYKDFIYFRSTLPSSSRQGTEYKQDDNLRFFERESYSYSESDCDSKAKSI